MCLNGLRDFNCSNGNGSCRRFLATSPQHTPLESSLRGFRIRCDKNVIVDFQKELLQPGCLQKHESTDYCVCCSHSYPQLLPGFAGGDFRGRHRDCSLNGRSANKSVQRELDLISIHFEALKHEKFLYLAAAGPYATATNAHTLLAERVESLVSQEHAKWASGQEQSKSKGRSEEGLGVVLSARRSAQPRVMPLDLEKCSSLERKAIERMRPVLAPAFSRVGDDGNDYYFPASFFAIASAGAITRSLN